MTKYPGIDTVSMIFLSICKSCVVCYPTSSDGVVYHACIFALLKVKDAGCAIKTVHFMVLLVLGSGRY